MRIPADLPSHLQLRSFTTREAEAAGVDAERLRRQDLVRPFHGVRSLRRPATLADRARTYAPRLSEAGFLSHTSAAALWGLPLPAYVDSRIHVSGPHGTRAVRTRGVIGHHLVIRDDEITVVDGVRVTTPERTWCDLAGWVGFEDLVAAGDRVLWHRDPLATPEALADLAHRHPGRRGRLDRRHAVPLLSTRADSPPESKIRTRIILAGLPRPEVNPVLRGPGGEWIGQPDLAFLDLREVLEYEGDGHRTDREQWLIDLERVPRFEEHDWHVTRAGANDLRDGSRRILLLLARLLEKKGWRGELRL